MTAHREGFAQSSYNVANESIPEETSPVRNERPKLPSDNALVTPLGSLCAPIQGGP